MMHPNNVYSAKSMMTTMKWLDAKHKHRSFRNHSYMLLNTEAKRKKHIRMRWIRHDSK